MKTYLLIPLVILLVFGLIFNGCAKPTTAPAPSPAPTPTPAPAPAPAPARAPTPMPTPAPAPKPTPEVKPIVLKLILWDVASKNQDDWDLGGWELVNRLEERSAGKIKFNHIGGPEVIPAREQPEAVRNGVADVTWSPTAYAAGFVPESNAIALTPIKRTECRKNGHYDIMNKAFNKGNLYYLQAINSSGYSEMFHFYLNIKIDKPEDLKGVKIRTSALTRAVADAFGAVSVSTPLPEAYTALERGMVEGVILPAEPMLFKFSLPDVLKYYVNPGFMAAQSACLINLDKWNSIPADLQKLMIDTACEVEEDVAPTYWRWHEEFLLELEKSGMTAINLPQDAGERLVQAFYKAAWDTIVKNSPEYGPQLREIAGY